MKDVPFEEYFIGGKKGLECLIPRGRVFLVVRLCVFEVYMMVLECFFNKNFVVSMFLCIFAH